MGFKKPCVFISHAHLDRPIVVALVEQLNRVFGKGLEIFASSVQGIQPGNDWFERIKSQLETATVFIVVVSPLSKDKNWVWFELGAYWSRAMSPNREHGNLYPLLIRLTPKDLERPLSDLQAMSLDKPEDITNFFHTLCNYLGFGHIELLDLENIIKSIPVYEDKKPVIYSSPYEGYTDDDLKAIMKEFLDKDRHSYRLAYANGTVQPEDRAFIFGGQLIHYAQLDSTMRLPLGTSKRLLKEVMETNYELSPNRKDDNENTVSFDEIPF